MNDKYYDAIYECASRYHNMVNLENDIDLYNFILRLKNCAKYKSLPLMKLNRWLGYIQGCLITKDYTTVEIERDWSRPYFQPLDFKYGAEILTRHTRPDND